MIEECTGHETTSGMLSFLCICLLNNPKALQNAQGEVDKVIGKGPITVDHISRMPYITACIREALRLWPTAPGGRVSPVSQNDEDYPMHIGKKGYKVYRNDVLQINLLKVHRDPIIYGADAESFRPERMLDEAFEKLPKNSWKASHAPETIFPRNRLTAEAIWQRNACVHWKVFRLARRPYRNSHDIAEFQSSSYRPVVYCKDQTNDYYQASRL